MLKIIILIFLLFVPDFLSAQNQSIQISDMVLAKRKKRKERKPRTQKPPPRYQQPPPQYQQPPPPGYQQPYYQQPALILEPGDLRNKKKRKKKKRLKRFKGSKGVRKRKPFSAAGNYIAKEGVNLQFGGNLGYAIKPNIELFGSFSLGSDSDVFPKEDSETYGDTIFLLEANQFLGGFRYFLSDTFFMSLGGGIRTIAIDMNSQNLISEENDTVLFDIQNFVTSFSIGNHWSLGSGFVVGLDSRLFFVAF